MTKRPAQNTRLGEMLEQDHRQLEELLNHLEAALAAQESGRAMQVVKELNRCAGSHMRFEEHFLYPELQSRLGVRQIPGLTQAHREAAADLQRLAQSTELGRTLEPEMQSWLASFRRQISICDQVLAAIEELPREKQQELQAKLEEWRGIAILLTAWKLTPNSSAMGNTQG